MGFFGISDYPNIGKNISGLLNHLKISIAKNRNTKIIEITKIVFPSFSCLKVFGFIYCSDFALIYFYYCITLYDPV